MATYNRILFMNGPWSGQEAFQQVPDGELYDLEGNALDLDGASYAMQVMQADATPAWAGPNQAPMPKVAAPAVGVAKAQPTSLPGDFATGPEMAATEVKAREKEGAKIAAAKPAPKSSPKAARKKVERRTKSARHK